MPETPRSRQKRAEGLYVGAGKNFYVKSERLAKVIRKLHQCLIAASTRVALLYRSVAAFTSSMA